MDLYVRISYRLLIGSLACSQESPIAVSSKRYVFLLYFSLELVLVSKFDQFIMTSKNITSTFFCEIREISERWVNLTSYEPLMQILLY